MYKVGDKLICNVSINYDTSGTSLLFRNFIKGVEYEILRIDFSKIYKIGKIDKNNSTYHAYQGFYYFNYNDVKKYFYTKKEARMKKLERIGNV